MGANRPDSQEGPHGGQVENRSRHGARDSAQRNGARRSGNPRRLVHPGHRLIVVREVGFHVTELTQMPRENTQSHRTTLAEGGRPEQNKWNSILDGIGPLRAGSKGTY